MSRSTAMLELCLPWPPTMNHYWVPQATRRTSGGRVAPGPARIVLADAGRKYRTAIVASARKAIGDRGGVCVFAPSQRLRVAAELCPPESLVAAWDIGNREKGLMDGLTHARVWHDDSQIDDLHLFRGLATKNGEARVLITVIEDVET
jgi:crossover junction endodeoxyribonuclease RusA